MRRIDFIVVHTAGAYDAERKRVVHQPVEVVRHYHILPPARYDDDGKLVPGTGGKGWHDLGYHRYVEQDGAVRMGRPDAVPGAHATRFNHHSLAVCCSGHGDYEPFNDAQVESLVAQCAVWCRLYAIDPLRIIGHRETALRGGPPVTKSCPGALVDMLAIRARVSAELAAAGRGEAR